jgi:hypothetical protein
MTASPSPTVDPKVQLLRELLTILERDRRVQGEIKVKQEIEQAVERINMELRGREAIDSTTLLRCLLLKH